MPLYFLITALLYGCVGFGGGSAYSALLVLGDTDYRAIPVIALVCNLIVVTGGVWHFYRKGHLALRALLPWTAASVPASFAGALLPVPETVFTGLLGAALSVSALPLFCPDPAPVSSSEPGPVRVQTGAWPILIGTMTGFIAGVTGIGGGIFLAPVLHILRWGNPKRIAGACAFFIFVNSLAGLAGQALKARDTDFVGLISPFWLLFPAVLIGGQVGAWMGSSIIRASLVKKGTGLVVLYAAVRLLMEFFALVS